MAHTVTQMSLDFVPQTCNPQAPADSASGATSPATPLAFAPPNLHPSSFLTAFLLLPPVPAYWLEGLLGAPENLQAAPVVAAELPLTKAVAIGWRL